MSPRTDNFLSIKSYVFWFKPLPTHSRLRLAIGMAVPNTYRVSALHSLCLLLPKHGARRCVGLTPFLLQAAIRAIAFWQTNCSYSSQSQGGVACCLRKAPWLCDEYERPWSFNAMAALHRFTDTELESYRLPLGLALQKSGSRTCPVITHSVKGQPWIKTIKRAATDAV